LAKILFLDFDGVLNSHVFAKKKPGGVLGLDPLAIELVNYICKRTNAFVVVSSTWRLGETKDSLQDMLNSVGFTGTIIGTTPDLSGHLDQKTGLWIGSSQRGDEIQAWIDSYQQFTYGPIESFAIIDDDSDMCHLASRHVKTSFSVGLTAADARRVVKLLGSTP
jgi:hypothetical protein